MKRGITAIALALGFSSLLFSKPAVDQNKTEVADVPFPFVVAERTLPAGKYAVSQLSKAAIFGLRDQHGDSLFVHLGTHSDGNPLNPSLTFACRANECVLTKVTPPNSLVAYGFGRPSVKPAQPSRLQMVSLVSIKLKAR